jgi:hypothetical protein
MKLEVTAEKVYFDGNLYERGAIIEVPEKTKFSDKVLKKVFEETKPEKK